MTREHQKVAPKVSTQGQDQAREVGPGRNRPLATLAHELKTPISAIAAAADVMSQEKLGPLGNDRYREYALDMRTSALHVLAIIDRLMAQRRGDEEGAKLTPVKIDADALLSDIVSAMQPLAQASGVILEPFVNQDRRETPLLFVADEVSVKQILLNLVNNGIKFTSIGGRVTLGAQEMADGSVKLSVWDTGLGMTSDQIAMALAGEAVLNGRSPMVGRGLGIGLPLVQALCEANGARLLLTSKGSQEGTSAEVVFGHG